MSRVVTALLAVLLFGCADSDSDPVLELKQEYVGEWRGPQMLLLIRGDGTVEYERSGENGNVSIKGPIKEFCGDDFVVGYSFLTTTFEVTEPPKQVDGRWQMVVDGVRLTRDSAGGSGPLRPASLRAERVGTALIGAARTQEGGRGMTALENLTRLGLSLPDAQPGFGTYEPWVRTGSLVMTSGQMPWVGGEMQYADGLGRS